MKTDSQLHRDVLDALSFEPSLNATSIGIAVKEGVVTLTGVVTSYAERWTAERVCATVAGVRGIAENLQVILPQRQKRTDTEIAHAVLSAFKWDVNVPNERLRVKVREGWITLMGDVDWKFQRNHAESAARFITGVRGVTNLIQVKPTITPKDVRARIEQAFNRQARINSSQVQVDVQGSKVTLSGTVMAYTEREEAEDAAWSAAGVTEVTNEIQIEPRLAHQDGHQYSAVDVLVR